MMHDVQINKAWSWAIVLVVFCLSVYVRLHGITEHGFHDSDEYAKYWFFTTDWYRHAIDGVSGSLWARPTSYMFNIFLGEQFGYSPELFTVKSALFGIATVIIVFMAARKFFDLQVGLLAMALLGGSLTMIYWSHTNKEVITSSFFFTISLYFLMCVVDRFQNSGEMKFADSVCFGFFIGLAFTCHPNLVVTFLSMGLVFGYVLMGYAFKSFKRAAIIGLGTLFASLLLIGFWEVFFFHLKASPQWGGEKNIGYVSFLLYHADLRNPVYVPSVSFYAGILKVENPLAAMLIFIGLVGGITIKSEKRHLTIMLAFICIFVIAVYANSKAWPAYRNIAHLLLPAYLLAAFSVATWLSQLQVQTSVKRVLPLLLVVAIFYPSLSQAERNSRLWSTAEDMHRIAGGGVNSAILRPKSPIYQWYSYYFPYHLVDNTKDLWTKYLCRGVDYLVFPELSQSPEWENLVKVFGTKMQNGADNFKLWDSAYLPLDNAFEFFENVHGHTLIAQHIEGLRPSDTPFGNGGQNFRVFSSTLTISPSANWVTVSGNLKTFGELDGNSVAIIGIGSEDEPFKYGSRIIEADVYSKNRHAQLIANNKAGFFKFGIEPSHLAASRSLTLRVYLRGDGWRTSDARSARVKIREYQRSSSMLGRCQETPDNKKSAKSALRLISPRPEVESNTVLQLKSGTNSIPANWLHPGAKYRLQHNYKMGVDTVGRIEIVNKQRLIAKVHYFEPSTKRQFVDFQVPYDLAPDRMMIYISTARGSRVEYADIELEKIND